MTPAVPAYQHPSLDTIAADLRETYLLEEAAAHGTWRMIPEIEKEHWIRVATRAIQLIAQQQGV